MRTERLQCHWSQRELAERIGATVATVKRWERQATIPSPYFRLKLTALFGKSEQELGLGDMNLLSVTCLEKETSEEEQMRSFPTDSSALWTVPYRRNPYFTGRDELLHLLDQHLSAAGQEELLTPRRAALTQPHAIKGLGGIGKTQIAVEYAYRSREQGHYTHTLWINAASQEAMMSSFTTLVEELPGFPVKHETDQQKLMIAIKRWLEQCQERWLLIFDNADDLSLVQKYIPHQGNGSILLTTRVNAVGSLAVSIDVEKMGFVEGTHLLLSRSQRFAQASDDEMNEAGNIVVALDHFPLALEQAGAYIEETGCSFTTYFQLYQTHRKALLARRGAQCAHYPDSVATTWSLSFQKVEQINPAAAELLQLCAFLASDHIPEELLKNGAPHWPPVLQQAAADLFTFNQMLETLLSYSLIKRLSENHQISIHRLVQVVQLDKMNPEEQRQWAERVVSAVNTVFPRDPKNEVVTWSQCLRYLEQAQTCDLLIKRWNLLLIEGADLLDRTGIYLHTHASYALAELLYQRALHIYEQRGEPEHPRVASLCNHLAALYREQGKYLEAEHLFQRTLHIGEHIDVAAALKELAIISCLQGKYAEAEPLFQRALHTYEQCLGSEHLEQPEVASSLSGLGNLFRMQGKYVEAEPLYQRALSIYEQCLGSEHSEVASSLNRLATLYEAQGKYMKAESLYQRALHIQEQNMGPEHPKVASSLLGLGNAYRRQGKYVEAEPLYQRTLHIYEQCLGSEHPEVASSLNNMGELYRELGKYTESESLYQRALRIREQSEGREHPYIAFSLHGLGSLYCIQRRYTEAEPLYQRALSILVQALEPDHPNIADVLQSFAALREAQSQSENAASLYRRALAIYEKVYGQQHPKTIDTRERLRLVSVVVLQEISRRQDE